MAGKGGGAWKVAYADFVTAMMAFFMVMWLTSQKPEVKKAVADYFKNPEAFRHPGTGNYRPPMDKSGRLSSKGPQKYVGSDQPSMDSSVGETVISNRASAVAISSAGNRIGIAISLTFDDGSDVLSNSAKEDLSKLIQVIKAMPYKLEIRGHVSPPQLPSPAIDEQLWQLCYKRSLAVLMYLTEHGIAEERLRLSQAGSFEPSVVEGAYKAAILNSRVEVFVLNETSEAYKKKEPQATDEHGDHDMSGSEVEHGHEDHGKAKAASDHHGDGH